jgi:hypothetical protein
LTVSIALQSGVLKDVDQLEPTGRGRLCCHTIKNNSRCEAIIQYCPGALEDIIDVE